MTIALKDLAAAAALNPERPENWNGIGALLLLEQRLSAAQPYVSRSLRIDPTRAETWLNAALCGGPSAACAFRFAAAIALAPALGSAWYNLANGILPHGMAKSAVRAAGRAVALDPRPSDAYSNWLLALHYPEGVGAEEIAAAHRRYGAFFTTVPAPFPRDDSAPLRIGYVSPDFGQHSIASFLPALIAAHEAEITLYSNRTSEDGVTAALRASARRFRTIAGLGDARAATLIAEDGIDVLVDLAGHTGGHRLGIFARRPAPLQATWLGYPDTTGLPAIDIRITDGIADPPGAEAHAQEHLVRIEGGFLAYRGPEDIEPAPPPCLAAPFVTFGSFNNLAKLTPAHARSMAEILRRAGRARLILKSSAFVDPEVREYWLQTFEAAGCDRKQIDLRNWIGSSRDHMALYREIDVALDSFPYAGTTTSFEALWMGVPVVTRTGDRHASRVGASILTHLGLGDLICSDAAQFTETAVALARNRRRLADLRGQLRPLIKRGPLGDPRRLAGAFERIFTELLEARRQGVPLKSIAARMR